jgi:Tetracyclin repressor-like, C-terminal domain
MIRRSWVRAPPAPPALALSATSTAPFLLDSDGRAAGERLTLLGRAPGTRLSITDGVTSGDFEVPDTGAATIAVLSLCLDVARWYRPGYRLTPKQLGDFNAVAALRIAGGNPAA